MSTGNQNGPDATAVVPVLWGMLAVLAILAVALMLTGQMTIGVALIVVAVSLSVVAMTAGKKTPGGDA